MSISGHTWASQCTHVYISLVYGVYTFFYFLVLYGHLYSFLRSRGVLKSFFGLLDLFLSCKLYMADFCSSPKFLIMEYTFRVTSDIYYAPTFHLFLKLLVIILFFNCTFLKSFASILPLSDLLLLTIRLANKICCYFTNKYGSNI